MKKIILSILFFVLLTGTGYSAVKVQFKLSNPHIETGGLWSIDVSAVIPAGQLWRVGSSNLRWNLSPSIAGAVTIHADNPVSGANVNLSNNSNYTAMTTTSITGGTAISLNIAHGNTAPCYYMTPGTYLIGRLRFTRVDTTACLSLIMRTTVSGFSVVQDSLTQWFSPADFDSLATTPAYCNRIDYLTGIGHPELDLPTVFKLYDNYPNPFNPTTTIKYDVPRNSFVKIVIYDILGKLVSTPVNEQKSAGRYDFNWNASNYASGTYFYKMETESYTNIKKMVLIK